MGHEAQASLFGAPVAAVSGAGESGCSRGDEAKQRVLGTASGCERTVGKGQSRGEGGLAVIEFVVPGEPVGKGRPRAFRAGAGVRMFTPEKTARYENLVAMAAQEAMAGRAPMEGAVAVGMVFVTVPPASWSMKKRNQALDGQIRPTTKPDCDNVLKAIADACNGIVWRDDKQITDVAIRKRYGMRPMAQVIVQPAEVFE